MTSSPRCALCDKPFARKDTLKLHVMKRHPTEFVNLYQKRSDFICSYCNKCFSRKYTLKEHVKRYHADGYALLYPEKTFYFQCVLCKRRFNHEHNLKSHLKIHTDQETFGDANPIVPSDKRKQKRCALCQTYTSYLTQEIVNHLKSYHDVIIESEELNFSSMAEFTEWKSQMEQDSSSQFRKETSKSSKQHVLVKYVCSRSGMYKPRGQGKRRLKLQGSKKINAFCPCSISLVINKEGKTDVSNFLNLSYSRINTCLT